MFTNDLRSKEVRSTFTASGWLKTWKDHDSILVLRLDIVGHVVCIIKVSFPSN